MVGCLLAYNHPPHPLGSLPWVSRLSTLKIRRHCVSGDDLSSRSLSPSSRALSTVTTLAPLPETSDFPRLSLPTTPINDANRSTEVDRRLAPSSSLRFQGLATLLAFSSSHHLRALFQTRAFSGFTLQSFSLQQDSHPFRGPLLSYCYPSCFGHEDQNNRPSFRVFHPCGSRNHLPSC